MQQVSDKPSHIAVSDSEKALRAFVKSKGLRLKDLTPRLVLELAAEFWLEQPVQGLVDSQGDGLVAYCDVMSRGRGTDYEFGVNRIFRVSDSVTFGWPSAFKLGLSVGFRIIPEHFALAKTVWHEECWHKERANTFCDLVLSNPSMGLILDGGPRNSGIRFSKIVSTPFLPFDVPGSYPWAVA